MNQAFSENLKHNTSLLNNKGEKVDVILLTE